MVGCCRSVQWGPSTCNPPPDNDMGGRLCSAERPGRNTAGLQVIKGIWEQLKGWSPWLQKRYGILAISLLPHRPSMRFLSRWQPLSYARRLSLSSALSSFASLLSLPWLGDKH